MIQSMTGYGTAEHVNNGVKYTLELKSVNHRYLKISINLPERWQYTERAVEQQIRSRVARGNVSCALRVRGEGDLDLSPVNTSALQRYVDELSRVQLREGLSATIDLGAVAMLPGVTRAPDFDDEERGRQLAIVEALVAQAIDALNAMRRDEGRALHGALLDCCGEVRGCLAKVAGRAPLVVDEYHARLKSRVETLMKGGGFELQEEGLMREVAIFAERCDITEELTRLESHVDQFADLCDRDEPVGRTLDFLTQELLREANTIASKSNDGVIARSVVEVKGLIDRLKEQIQNVE